jgi:catechol-2,3-dioxygenase
VGLYHIGRAVAKPSALVEMKGRLEACGALVGASDHGGNLSIYARDPDGLEFEIMWLVPRSEWGEAETEALIRPLDLAAAMERFGADRPGGG